MRDIPVYKAERDLGLFEQIRASAKIVYATELKTFEGTPQETYKKLEQAAKDMTAKATNEGQVDLYYLQSILATVGWNKNDDVFDKKETWIARATPEDKPFNIEHNPREVRGHITGNYVIDLKGNIIPDNSTIDELPDEYHVVTSSVLYKFLKSGDEALEKEMAQIIAEVKAGKWFVSMEALFDDFDYAIVGSNGGNKVIARSNDSAFLTKHLRAYGGTGVYEGNKIGRLLRNIIFSGKGLVQRPANPHSIIFDNVTAFEKVAFSSVKELGTTGYVSNSSQIDFKQESSRMAAEVTQVELLQNENKRLEQTLSAAVQAQKEAEKRLVEMNEQAVKAKIEGLSQDVKARDEKINSLTTQVQTEQKARTEAEAKVSDLEKKNTELQGQLTKVQADSKKVARIATITTELSLNAEEAQKFYDEEVADFNLSDERFTKLVASFKKIKGNPPAKVEGGDNSNKNVIDNAQRTDKTASLGTEGVNNDVEKTRTGLGKFLGSYIHRNSRTSAKKNEGE